MPILSQFLGNNITLHRMHKIHIKNNKHLLSCPIYLVYIK